MNFEIIKTIIGFACLVPIVHSFDYYKSTLKYFGLDMKPFSCILCSTFWLTFGFNVIPHGFDAIFIASVAAILAELIDIQIHKL